MFVNAVFFCYKVIFLFLPASFGDISLYRKMYYTPWQDTEVISGQWESEMWRRFGNCRNKADQVTVLTTRETFIREREREEKLGNQTRHFPWFSSVIRGECLDCILKQSTIDSSPIFYNSLYLHNNYFVSAESNLAIESLNKLRKINKYLTWNTEIVTLNATHSYYLFYQSLLLHTMFQSQLFLLTILTFVKDNQSSIHMKHYLYLKSK
jgi:hypothetical protein